MTGPIVPTRLPQHQQEREDGSGVCQDFLIKESQWRYYGEHNTNFDRSEDPTQGTIGTKCETSVTSGYSDVMWPWYKPKTVLKFCSSRKVAKDRHSKWWFAQCRFVKNSNCKKPCGKPESCTVQKKVECYRKCPAKPTGIEKSSSGSSTFDVFANALHLSADGKWKPKDGSNSSVEEMTWAEHSFSDEGNQKCTSSSGYDRMTSHVASLQDCKDKCTEGVQDCKEGCAASRTITKTCNAIGYKSDGHECVIYSGCTMGGIQAWGYVFYSASIPSSAEKCRPCSGTDTQVLCEDLIKSE